METHSINFMSDTCVALDIRIQNLLKNHIYLYVLSQSRSILSLISDIFMVKKLQRFITMT